MSALAILISKINLISRLKIKSNTKCFATNFNKIKFWMKINSENYVDSIKKLNSINF